MEILDVGLTGEPQQLPSSKCGKNGCLLLRQAGTAAILVGTSAVEITIPLPGDLPVKMYPGNISELWILGTKGETLHLVVF